ASTPMDYRCSMDVHIGCSGYYYRHWQGPWYPEALPASRWFAFYAEHFDTVEINSSFYRFPTAATARRWLRQAPDGFVYSLKAPRLITHLKRFHDCASLLDDFYGVLAGLGAHLGCVLFQLPPSLHFSEPMLAQLAGAMRPDFRNVIEFRHAGWWRPEVFAALRESRIGFCSVAAPGLPDELVVTAPDVYLRLHGDPWYAQDYSEAELAAWAARLEAADAMRAWVYFNNDHHAFATANAAALKRLLAA
ncbi:MAG TPA: DUF72 domain-containing protein, partial [Mariprofundaceae bacterium]|nr:DUF72 domain-containing protein [Mariprofundaceae bacterium]